MNIFVTSESPTESAIVLPDKHIVKMPLECCQMLAIVAVKEEYGELPKKDGTSYKITGHKNHPCTIWAGETIDNAHWLLEHGLELCHEYAYRYNKIHGCYWTLMYAREIFPEGDIKWVTPFVRAMPDELKLDLTIGTFEAYKRYLASKEWVKSNYLRIPSRKPEWI